MGCTDCNNPSKYFSDSKSLASIDIAKYAPAASGNYKGAVMHIDRPAPSLALNYGGMARPYQ